MTTSPGDDDLEVEKASIAGEAPLPQDPNDSSTESQNGLSENGDDRGQESLANDGDEGEDGKVGNDGGEGEDGTPNGAGAPGEPGAPGAVPKN